MITSNEILSSWKSEENPFNSTDEILSWVNDLNQKTYANVKETSIYNSDFWFYDDYKGEITNRRRSFFSVIGMRYFVNNAFVGEQPIIVQPEIGYLGIITKLFDNQLFFLMQAKVEPGNVNCVQISPTIQATKSNFMRVHGGNLPLYFNYFENSERYEIIYDQIQSEQGARFLKKRNRNIIICLSEEIEVYPNFKWMTLGQIKHLMKIDNLVNMDTRTVLSGLPIFFEKSGEKLNNFFSDDALYASMYKQDPKRELPNLYQKINNFKMFQDTVSAPIPLNQLVDWRVDEYGITCLKPYDFSVFFYDIEISGREVRHWTQPLFKANGNATFGLIAKTIDGVRMFLVQFIAEIGSFDKIEIGPSVQWSATHSPARDNEIDKCFRRHVRNHGCAKGGGGEICFDAILSEEGGRFYHEQNRNVIISVSEEDITIIPDNYIWLSYSTLNYLIQVNNCVNIQLRNLISLIDI